MRLPADPRLRRTGCCIGCEYAGGQYPGVRYRCSRCGEIIVIKVPKIHISLRLLVSQMSSLALSCWRCSRWWHLQHIENRGNCAPDGMRQAYHNRIPFICEHCQQLEAEDEDDDDFKLGPNNGNKKEEGPPEKRGCKNVS